MQFSRTIWPTYLLYLKDIEIVQRQSLLRTKI